MTGCPSNHSKLFIAVLSALAITFTVSGCGGGSDSEADGDQGVADISPGGNPGSSLPGDASEPEFVAPEGPAGARLRFGVAVGAPLASPLSSIASVATAAYQKINACLKNKEIGQPCLASDAANIRETLKQVKDLRTAIDRNAKELQAEFDAIRQLIGQSDLARFSNELIGMVINTTAVSYAYEALALCASTTEATCSPYIGEANAPAIDVPTAIAKTKGYMAEKLQLLPFDMPSTATKFTGTAVFGYRDGLADTLWRYNRLTQGREVGVKVALKDVATVPVVTSKLANEHNSDIRYWVDVFTKYAFFRVMRDGFLGDEAALERRQAEANTYISSSVSRASVYGTGQHYILPSLPDTSVVLVDWADASKQETKAWIVTNATARGAGTRPLQADDIDTLVRIASTYVEAFKSFQSATGVLPKNGWYYTWTPVERIQYRKIRVVPYTTPYKGEWFNVQVNWLTQPGNATDWCSVKAKPTPEGEAAGNLSGRAVHQKTFYEVQTEPAPRHLSLLDPWDRFVKGKRFEYNWDTYTLTSPLGGKEPPLLGLGAWVACEEVSPDSYIQLVKVPNLMAPVQ